MKDKIFTRMGDGERVSMSAEEIKEDIVAATREAAQRAEIPELTTAEIEQLLAIMAEPSRAVSVAPGQEVIVTDDGCSMSFYSGQDGGGVGVPMSRLQAVLTYERACAADTTSMGHSDYSFKPVKPIINFEMNEYYTASMMTTAPFLYGAQPNMGLYFQPDGPHPNPADLLPRGKSVVDGDMEHLVPRDPQYCSNVQAICEHETRKLESALPAKCEHSPHKFQTT